MGTTYVFNPLNYGFEPISNFPELLAANGEEWFGSVQNVFVKVTAIGDSKMFDRKVFWYTACTTERAVGTDQRIEFYGHAFDENRGVANFSENKCPLRSYFGTVSNDDFAKQLLQHLFSALTNESVGTHGKERLETNLNEKLRKEWPVTV